MDKKIEIKEEDLLEHDISSQNEREFFQKIVITNTNIDDVTDCEITVKTEIKSETPFIKDLCKRIKSETAIWNNCDKNGEFEIDNQIEIKEESCLETETSSIGNNTKVFEMDKKIEIKEEDLLEDGIGSQNEREFFQKIVTTNTNIDDVTDCEITVKTEIKSETPFIKDLCKQIKSETAIWNNCDKNGEFEIDNQIEIKEESCLETETSSIGNNTKYVALPPVKSSRLYPETGHVTTLGKSPLFSAEVPTRDPVICNGNYRLQYDYQKCDVLTAQDDVQCDQHGKCSDGADTFTESLYVKPSSFSDISKTTQQSSICDKSFRPMSNLEKDNLIPVGKKQYQCQVCDKSFTQLSTLKRHNLIHEGLKQHKCKVCDKSFTQLSNLKRHNLTHEGKKPYKCNVCDKSFTRFSTLKIHKFIHEGKKPQICKVCDKSFTHLSTLQSHNLIHEGKKPYKCKVCDKSFTHLSTLKTHNLVHEGRKPHKCKVCDRSFTRLCHLKSHYLIHEGKRPHKCKVCDRSFTRLSYLNSHNLIHEGKKSYNCKVCDKGFEKLSTLKTHNLIHEGKKLHNCKRCDKSFTRFSYLKKHNLVHEGKSAH